MHPCPKCPYSTRNQNAIVEHMKSVHEKLNEAACKICEHKASSEHQLRRHVRAHKKHLACGTGKCSYLTSFNNVMEKWHPEVTHYCPDVPIVLAGTKTDLRDDKETTTRLLQVGEKPVTKEMVSFPLAVVNMTTS